MSEWFSVPEQRLAVSAWEGVSSEARLAHLSGGLASKKSPLTAAKKALAERSAYATRMFRDGVFSVGVRSRIAGSPTLPLTKDFWRDVSLEETVLEPGVWRTGNQVWDIRKSNVLNGPATHIALRGSPGLIIPDEFTDTDMLFVCNTQNKKDDIHHNTKKPKNLKTRSTSYKVNDRHLMPKIHELVEAGYSVWNAAGNFVAQASGNSQDKSKHQRLKEQYIGWRESQDKSD